LSNKVAAVLFFSGIIAAVSVPFLIDIAKDGQLDDSPIEDLVNGLDELDQVTRLAYLAVMTALLPFACFSALQKKITPNRFKFLIFLTGNAFAFGIMTLYNMLLTVS